MDCLIFNAHLAAKAKLTVSYRVPAGCSETRCAIPGLLYTLAQLLQQLSGLSLLFTIQPAHQAVYGTDMTGKISSNSSRPASVISA